MFDRLASEEALAQGWAKVFANAGGPGGDRVTVHDFAARLSSELARLVSDLRHDHYAPGPLRRVSIPKKSGGTRPLAIPCVRDRVAQSALHILLEPIFEPMFSDASFGYRPGRGVQDAIARVRELHREGYRHVIDADITRYFESVPHALLMERLRAVAPDPRILRLIASWLDQEPGARGLAQGSPISPILSNFYLDQLDDALVGKGVRIVRFADDFVILCRSADIASGMVGRARKLLSDLGLELNPEKTRLVDFDRGFRFLGRMFLKGFVIDADDADEYVAPDAGGGAAPLAPPAALVAPKAAPGPPDVANAAPLDEDSAHLPQTWAPADAGAGQHLSAVLRPVYCVTARRRLGLRGEAFAVFEEDAVVALLAPRRVGRIEIGPHAAVDADALRHALEHGVSVAFVSHGGLTLGALAQPPHHGAGHLDQARARLDPERRMTIARAFADARARNQRALLSRLNRRRKDDRIADAASKIGRIALKLQISTNVEAARAVEAEATALYWPAFGRTLLPEFALSRRDRGVANSPADVLLSFGSGVLTRDIEALLLRHGLHTGIAFLHAERDREAPLAWDVIEPYRAPLVEGLVAYAVNNRVVTMDHMAKREDGSWTIDADGRDRFIRAYESWIARPVRNRREGCDSLWRGLIESDILALKRAFADDGVFAPYVMDY